MDITYVWFCVPNLSSILAYFLHEATPVKSGAEEKYEYMPLDDIEYKKDVSELSARYNELDNAERGFSVLEDKVKDMLGEDIHMHIMKFVGIAKNQYKFKNSFL